MVIQRHSRSNNAETTHSLGRISRNTKMRLRLNIPRRYDGFVEQGSALTAVDETSDDTNYVCGCLRITEHQLLATLATKNCWTIRDIRKTIGAGDGCTTCHHVLKRYLTVHQRMEREERTEPSPSHPHRHVPD